MSTEMIPVRPAVVDGILKYAEISSLFAKKAMDELAVHQQAQKKAADLRPELLEHMLKTEAVKTQQKQAADELLATHEGTMQLLKNAIDKIAALKKDIVSKEARDLGAPAGPAGTEKSASDYNSLSDGRVGMKTSNVKESDKPLLALIGQS